MPRTPPSVTWLVDRSSGNTPASDFTHDAKHRITVLTAGKNAVTKGVDIVFSKPKTFGVHTDMYTVVVPTADRRPPTADRRPPTADLGYRIDLGRLNDGR